VNADGADTLKTRPTLLSKVRKGDEDGWSRFYELYQRFIYGAARGAGLSHEESQDVVQDVMIAVRKYISDFIPDRNRARFRTWLGHMVQFRIADQFRRRRRNPLAHPASHGEAPPVEGATSTTDRLPDPKENDLGDLIDSKLEEAILDEARQFAKESVRMEHYQAYDLFDVQELSAREVAVSLGINPVTVRVWAFRVRRVIAQEMRRILRQLDHPRAGYSR
jgi:RNA polymerase sigma factor (sigma-70 family)